MDENQTGAPAGQTPTSTQEPTTPEQQPVPTAGDNSATPESQPQNPENTNPAPQNPGDQEAPSSVVQPAKGEGFLGKIAKFFKR